MSEEARPAQDEGDEGAPTEGRPDGPAATLPEGVLTARLGPGANCSSAGSAIDVLFYGSVIAGAIAVALAAAFPPRERRDEEEGEGLPGGDGEPRR